MEEAAGSPQTQPFTKKHKFILGNRPEAASREIVETGKARLQIFPLGRGDLWQSCDCELRHMPSHGELLQFQRDTSDLQECRDPPEGEQIEQQLDHKYKGIVIEI